MDEILQQFYAEVKRKDDTDYEPSSLANMQAALDRRLMEAGYMYSLFFSRYFLNSRNALEGKARLLREQGKGKRPNKSCSLSNDKIEQLWQSVLLDYQIAAMTILVGLKNNEYSVFFIFSLATYNIFPY